MFRDIKTLLILIFFIINATAVSSQETTPFTWVENFFSGTPEIEATCDKKQIETGDSALIKWKAEKADSVVLWNTKETLPVKGQMYVRPTEKSFYKFVAYNALKTNRSIIRINVLMPTIKTFTGNANINDEAGGKLQWECENTEKVIIKELGKSFPPKSSINITPDTSMTYTLVAENKYGKQTEKTFDVTVSYIENISKDTSILLFDTAKITWKFKNTRHVIIGGNDSLFSPISELFVAPKTSTEYVFRIVRNYGDTLTKKVKITVLKPDIKYFKGTKHIFAGEPAQLQWFASHVDSVYIRELGRYFRPRGSIKVSPPKKTTYHLTINSKGIFRERTHTIDVYEKRSFVKDFVQIDKLAVGQRIDFEVFATDISNYPQSIKLFVLAVDTAGNFIRGLAPPYTDQKEARKYFKSLIEQHKHGKPYWIKDFDVKEVREQKKEPYDINLTLDYSGSMFGSIPSLEKACKYLIENKNDEDSISIVRFDNNLVLETPLTSDKKRLLDSLNSPNAFKEFGGWTALYAGSDEGLQTLDSSKRKKQQILFTDGYENGSFSYWETHAFNGQILALKARERNTPIHVAALGEFLNVPLLKELASLTGGNYYQIYDNDQIEKVFKEIPLLFRNYYVISYKPQIWDGQRTIQLIYNNNLNQDFVSKRKVHIGENFDLLKYEYEDSAYWRKMDIDLSGKTVISPPQAAVLYDFDKDIIDQEFIENLDFYVEFLLKKKDIDVFLFGHTDHVGSHAYCDDLSQRRANSVKEYFINKGIDKNRIKTYACGKRYPVWKKETEAWKARENRRVEILTVK